MNLYHDFVFGERIFLIVKITLRFYFEKQLHKIVLQWLNNIIEQIKIYWEEIWTISKSKKPAMTGFFICLKFFKLFVFKTYKIPPCFYN